MGSSWQTPSTIPPLFFEGVQVWRLVLSNGVVRERLDGLYGLLDAEEKRRADGIRVPPVLEEFIAGRGLLRLLLAHGTGMAPTDVRLATGPNGKPSLHPATGLEFNVSHSEGMILIALSRASEVGVDVEHLSREFGEGEELMEMARESFDARELGPIARAPAGPERLHTFFRAWTLREAVAKADGRGIASGLKYAVQSADEFGECRVALAACEGSRRQADVDYFVQMPPVGQRHLAAVAVRKPRQAISLYDAGGLQG